MKEDIVTRILSTSGYLPPRNEEEMIAFERLYSKVSIDEDFHVDVESIINGGCQFSPKDDLLPRQTILSRKDLRLAARNFECIPNEVIDKIKKQHQGNDK